MNVLANNGVSIWPKRPMRTAPSLDTTINAKSSLLHNLACNPDQWQKLRGDPTLIASAVVEGVRHSATVHWFSRFAVADYRQGDVFIPDGAA